MYEAQADTINVDDIAKNRNNRIILHRLRRNDTDDENYELLCIQNHANACTTYYSPEGADDMGWLGYFIGKNQHLKDLIIVPFTPTSGSSVRDVMEPFLRGISRNKSIREISFASMDLLVSKCSG